MEIVKLLFIGSGLVLLFTCLNFLCKSSQVLEKGDRKKGKKFYYLYLASWLGALVASVVALAI